MNNGETPTLKVKTTFPSDNLTFNNWAIYINNESNRIYKNK